jgi:TPR repeat protein
MGAVFDAMDTHATPPERVAVKVIAKKNHGGVIQELFGREQSFAQALVTAEPDEHENHFFVRVLASDRSPTSPYLVMEHLGPPEWRTLAGRLESAPGGRMSIDETARLGIQFARSLARLAGKRIVHRDLKPENVFVSEQGYIKIADLGGGIDYGSEMTSPLKEQPAVRTPGYASPDHFEPRTMTTAADMFSVGCILWRCATGVLPYEFSTYGMPLLEPPTSGQDIPLDLRQFLLTMLDERPAGRPSPKALREFFEQRRAQWLLGQIRQFGLRVVEQGETLANAVQGVPADATTVARAGAIGRTLLQTEERFSAFQKTATTLGAAVRGEPLIESAPEPAPSPSASPPVAPHVPASPARSRVLVVLATAAVAMIAGIVTGSLLGGRAATGISVAPGSAPPSVKPPTLGECSGRALICPFRRECDAGDGAACLAAGRLTLQRPWGKDARLAALLFERACKQNIADACQELTRLTFNTFIPAEQERALAAMTTMCTVNHHVESCIDLAHAQLFSDQPAVWKDASERITPLCERDHIARACRVLGRLKVFSPSPSLYDPRTGVTHLRTSCNAGLHEACGELAFARLIGVPGTSGDTDELVADAAAACDADNGRACFAIGMAERKDHVSGGRRLAESCMLDYSEGCAAYARWLYRRDSYLKARDTDARKSLLAGIADECDNHGDWSCLFESELGDADAERQEMILRRACRPPAVPQGCAALAEFLVARGDKGEAQKLVDQRCERGEGDFQACYVLATNRGLTATDPERKKALARACKFLPVNEYPACR